jgi:hypothetical protein
VETILHRGTSADRQLAVYQAEIEEGRTHAEALQRVKSWLQEETLACCFEAAA